MNIADRIQHLRKEKGVSQEELANKLGVSRQAVSKWESEQSIPDIEKIVLLSDIFNISTDYLLKGVEPISDKKQKEKEFAGKVLYISSTAFIAIGLFCAFSGWHEEHNLESVWGSMIIQVIGIAAYYIGKLFSTANASLFVKWLNIIGTAFMPLSLVSGYISIQFFKQGWIAPYPLGIWHTMIFIMLFLAAVLISFLILRKTKGKLISK